MIHGKACTDQDYLGSLDYKDLQEGQSRCLSEWSRLIDIAEDRANYDSYSLPDDLSLEHPASQSTSDPPDPPTEHLSQFVLT